MLLKDLLPLLINYIYIYNDSGDDWRPIFKGFNYEIEEELPKELLNYKVVEISSNSEIISSWCDIVKTKPYIEITIEENDNYGF